MKSFIKIKEYEKFLILYLFGIVPVFFVKKPQINENTFLLWEPCSKSHAEVLPGYAKHLLDMGYNVSVLLTPDRIKEGLFSKFEHTNLYLNKMSQSEIRRYFKYSNLEDIKGVLITTAGKLCDSVHYEDMYSHFSQKADRNKLFFVEHEVKPSMDEGTWNKNFITLRQIDYKNAESVVVNPNYFGEKIKIKDTKNDITTFITIGAIRPKRNNTNMIVDAVQKLHNSGITNFKVIVVGKGHLKELPKELHKYFDIKGRLPFKKMYDEIEKSDFILTSYDDKNEKHRRYITTGTSGTFQLVYGFLKPCIIIKSFAPINGFDSNNSILYETPDDYSNALEQAINMNNDEYKQKQNNLLNLVNNVNKNSFDNLKNLIEKS